MDIDSPFPICVYRLRFWSYRTVIARGPQFVCRCLLFKSNKSIDSCKQCFFSDEKRFDRYKFNSHQLSLF